MLFKIFVIFALLVILYCLGSGLFYLVREDGKGSTRMVKALTWRIALSIGLFIVLFVAYWMGWIHPHAIIVSPN